MPRFPPSWVANLLSAPRDAENGAGHTDMELTPGGPYGRWKSSFVIRFACCLRLHSSLSSTIIPTHRAWPKQSKPIMSRFAAKKTQFRLERWQQHVAVFAGIYEPEAGTVLGLGTYGNALNLNFGSVCPRKSTSGTSFRSSRSAIIKKRKHIDAQRLELWNDAN